MKKTPILLLLVSLVFLTAMGTTSAQDDGFLVIPVELFACTYNDGKSSADLDTVVDKWNKWADKEGIDNYAAWTLTPYYYGPEQEFDVIWLGAGKDAVALGKTQDTYLAENAGLHADFDDVLSCQAHANFASLNYKAAPEGRAPNNEVLTFSDCSYQQGATFQDVGAAMGKWSKHLSDGGSATTIFHWYPVYGGGKEEFDFKWIQIHENFAALGADYERYGNGGGFAVNGRLFNHLIECDSTRAYVAQNRRYVKLR